MKHLKKIIAIIVVGLAIPSGLLFLSSVGAFDFFELKLLDMRFRFLNKGITPSQDIIMIDIDEYSLKEVGRWPWNRDVYYPVLNYLNARKAEGKGPKAIFFDIFYTEPTNPDTQLNSITSNYEKLYSEIIEPKKPVLGDKFGPLQEHLNFLKEKKKEKDHDATFIQGNAEFKDVYHNMQLMYNFDGKTGKPDPVKKLPEDYVKKFSYDIQDLSNGLYKYPPANYYERPIDGLWQATKGITIPTIKSDIDGIYRKSSPVFKYDEKHYLSFAVQAYLEKKGLKPSDVKISKDGNLQIGDQTVPLYDSLFNLYFYTKPFIREAFAWSWHQGKKLLLGDFGENPEQFMKDMEAYDDKIIIIGTSASATYDIKPNPIEPSAPGALLHATFISNLLQGDFIKYTPFWVTVVTMLIITLLSSFLIIYFANFVTLIVIPAGVFILFSGSACLLFKYFDLAMNISAPFVGIIFSVIGSYAYFSFTEGKDKKFLKAAFGNYISPELIEMMHTSGQAPKLGGDVGIRTAYFTDIASFSSFSEKLSAPQLVELLNEYLTAMTDILLAEEGTLDKYEGDAIIAFFGAPMPMEDHAIRACRVAVEMQDKLLELREKWTSEGDKWPKIVHNMRMRIGVNSGEIVTGNMGSKTRMNYTMMGDSVNLAARLEEAAKQYGIFTQISHFTRDLIGDHFELRELDTMRVVGKSEPVTTYDVLGMTGKTAEHILKLKESFAAALELYKNQKWDDAIAKFEATVALEHQRFPGLEDKPNPSLIYIERCKQYKENPPGEDWDGVYTLTSK